MGSVLLAVERPFAAALLAASLSEAGFEVDWAANPQRAAQLSKEHPYDAVIVDLTTTEPKIRHSALAEFAASIGEVPLVAIAPDRPPVLSVAVRFVVRRPYAGGQLITAVRAAIAQARTAPSGVDSLPTSRSETYP